MEEKIKKISPSLETRKSRDRHVGDIVPVPHGSSSSEGLTGASTASAPSRLAIVGLEEVTIEKVPNKENVGLKVKRKKVFKTKDRERYTDKERTNSPIGIERENEYRIVEVMDSNSSPELKDRKEQEKTNPEIKKRKIETEQQKEKEKEKLNIQGQEEENEMDLTEVSEEEMTMKDTTKERQELNDNLEDNDNPGTWKSKYIELKREYEEVRKRLSEMEKQLDTMARRTEKGPYIEEAAGVNGGKKMGLVNENRIQTAVPPAYRPPIKGVSKLLEGGRIGNSSALYQRYSQNSTVMVQKNSREAVAIKAMDRFELGILALLGEVRNFFKSHMDPNNETVEDNGTAQTGYYYGGNQDEEVKRNIATGESVTKTAEMRYYDSDYVETTGTEDTRSKRKANRNRNRKYRYTGDTNDNDTYSESSEFTDLSNNRRKNREYVNTEIYAGNGRINNKKEEFPPLGKRGNAGFGNKLSWGDQINRQRRRRKNTSDNSTSHRGSTLSVYNSKKIKEMTINTLKKRIPKTAAVIINNDGTGFSYAEALKKARKEIDLDSLGIGPTKIRRAATGGVIIEIPGGDANNAAEKLAAKLRETLRDPGMRITRPSRRTDLRIYGIDDSITKEDVIEEIAKKGGCSKEAVKCSPIRFLRGGLGVAWAQCPIESAVKILELDRFELGWTSVKVEAVKNRPLQCYKCWASGHAYQRCPNQTDRRNCCYRCGGSNHLAKECKNEIKCPVCEERGMRADHRAGGPACVPVPPKT